MAKKPIEHVVALQQAVYALSMAVVADSHVAETVKGLWDVVAEAAPIDIESKSWRGIRSPQEVFIEPVCEHALVKLISNAASLSNTLLLGQSNQFAVSRIKHYLEAICDDFNLNHKSLIKY